MSAGANIDPASLTGDAAIQHNLALLSDYPTLYRPFTDRAKELSETLFPFTFVGASARTHH